MTLAFLNQIALVADIFKKMSQMIHTWLFWFVLFLQQLQAICSF